MTKCSKSVGIQLKLVDNVATCCYITKMEEIETVGLRNFSNSVSAYVRKAALGVRVLLSDRGKVVAELVKPGSRPFDEDLDPLVRKWQERGWLKKGTQTKLEFPEGPPLVSKGRTEELLSELREEKY